MMAKNIVTTLFLTLMFSLPSASALTQQATKSPETSALNAPADAIDKKLQNTPEYALRKFMLATCSGNLKMLKKFSHPHDDIEVLIPTEKLPEVALKQMKTAFQAMPITKLKVGDSMALPSGKSITFDASQIDENHAVLTFPNNPFPIPAVRIEGHWKINPTKMIAIRKAAQQLMQRQRENAIQSIQKKELKE